MNRDLRKGIFGLTLLVVCLVCVGRLAMGQAKPFVPTTPFRGTLTVAQTGTTRIGSVCICTDQAATPAAAGCSVAGSVVTANGTAAHVLSVYCF